MWRVSDYREHVFNKLKEITCIETLCNTASLYVVQKFKQNLQTWWNITWCMSNPFKAYLFQPHFSLCVWIPKLLSQETLWIVGQIITVMLQTNSNKSVDMLNYNQPSKQYMLMLCNILKKFIRCSGNSSRSLFIISSVHSNKASRICGTLSVTCAW